ncbi:glycosyltransferase family 2 protein [Chloroflexota bacterium]
MTDPLISVIIPTFNRKAMLQQTLQGLGQQNIPMQDMEVIVVDDGSTDGTDKPICEEFPFQFKLLQQRHIGAAIARNYGARESRGRILISMDDDILLKPGALPALVELCLHDKHIISLGTLIQPDVFHRQSTFASLNYPPTTTTELTNEVVHFKWCINGLMAIRREDFFALEMFQDPIGCWPDWLDIDFGFRAHKKGFKFIRSYRAVAEHWDYALMSLKADCDRWEGRSKTAVRLFQVHPELKQHISLFLYSFPIDWRRDPFRIIFRKSIRFFASAKIPLWVLERMTRDFEAWCQISWLLRRLYRWVTAAYIYRGFQQGMDEYGRIDYYTQS